MKIGKYNYLKEICSTLLILIISFLTTLSLTLLVLRVFSKRGASAAESSAMREKITSAEEGILVCLLKTKLTLLKPNGAGLAVLYVKLLQLLVHGIEVLLLLKFVSNFSKKTLRDPLCLGRCEHYFCWSCAEVHLGKACPLCFVPSHVRDAQPNRQLGAATSLCGRLMAVLGLSDQSGQDPETDPVLDEALLHMEASRLSETGKGIKLTSIEETKTAAPAVDIRPRVAPGRRRSSNLKFTDSKPWNEKVGVHHDNGDVCGRTKERKSEENMFLSENLSDIVMESSSEQSKNGLGRKIDEKECARPAKRMRVPARTDIQMDIGITEEKKRLSLKSPVGNVGDAEVNVATHNEMRGSEGQQEDKIVVRGRKKRRVLSLDASATEISGHVHQERSISKSEENAGFGDGNVQIEADSTSEEKERCSSTSMSSRRNVQTPSCTSKQGNKNRRSNDDVGFFLKPKAQGEFPSPDVGIKADNSSTSSSGHFLSSLFSTPKSQSSGRTDFGGRKGVRSPMTPQLTTPKSALVTPKTKRSPKTPRSGRGSAQKRNGKGETRLHIECIKGDLDAVRSLLEEGENPNIRDFANWTPLHEACNHGYVKIAELLLNYGAMINIPGGENSTPLHDAVQNYRLECVRLLVSRGASKTLRDLHGKTPADLALTSDMKDALNVPVNIIDAVVPTSQSIGTSSLTLSQSVTLLSTGLDAVSKSSLMECAKKLNWKVMNNFSPEVTHLVTSANKEGVCIRTIKYLQAILTGKWIVSFDWIRACDKDSCHVEEEPFEISGSTQSPKSFAPRKGRLCVVQQLPLLFNGCHFYFHGDFRHPSPSKDDLSKLVKLGSGLVLAREPKQETIDQSDFIVPYHADSLASLANCGYFIVSDNFDFVMIGPRMCRVSPTWILSCIAEFRLA